MRNRRARFSRANHRETTWATVGSTAIVAAADDYNTIDLLAGFKADGGTTQGVTITRTHLRIIPTTPTPVAGSNFYVGLIRGQASDVGANVPGAPAPASSPYEDWLLWDYVWSDYATTISVNDSTQLQYDLKAQRRLPELQMNYNLVIEVPSWASFPATFQVTGRILLKLP